MRIRIVAAACFAAWVSVLPAQFPASVRLERDLAYAKAGGSDLLLDLYLPDPPDPKPRPVVIFLHGGGFRGGSKNNPEGVWLVPRGYALASVNYRLSGEATAPAQIHDAKAAVRWLRSHSEEYGFDSDRFGVWGTSAGGHLAALVGTSGEVEEIEGDVGVTGVSSRVQAVVDFYGAGDLVETYRVSERLRRPLEFLLGGPLDQRMELAKQFSANTYFSRDDPPFLLVQGDQDPLVPPQLSESLHQALLAAGLDSTLRVVKGEKHGFKIGPNAESELAGLVEGFLNRWLRR